jgi:hypothetical protein
MNRPYTGTPSIKGLALVGLLIFGGYQIFKTVDNKDWPEVTGKVTNIRVDESYRYRTTRYNSGHYEYTGVVEYIYLVDHVSHQGQANLRTFHSRMQAQDHANSMYRKGQHLQVIYNPKHPDWSSLTRSVI